MEPLYSGHPWGTKFWPLYRGGLYCGVVLHTTCSFGTWIPGRYTEVAFIQGWPLRGVPLYILWLCWFSLIALSAKLVRNIRGCMQNVRYGVSLRFRKTQFFLPQLQTVKVNFSQIKFAVYNEHGMKYRMFIYKLYQSVLHTVEPLLTATPE